MIERIKRLCKEYGTSIAALERRFGYGNGSLVKAGDRLPAVRLFEIAQLFNVSMDYLMTGKEDIVARDPAASGVPISRDAGRIIDKFYSLDEVGRKKVEEYMDDLISSGKYKKVQALDA